MKTLSNTLVLLFASLCLPAHAVYKCVDEKGVTHYGDTPPPQCATKAITEMSQQGSVVKKIDAPLTAEQLKAQADSAGQRKVLEKKIAEQKLRDNALMSTYGSEREFDVARDKDIAVLEARKKSLMARNADVDKLLSKVEIEMEFYKAGKSKVAKTKDGKEVKEVKAEAKTDARVDGKGDGKTKEMPPQLVADHNRAKANRTGLDTEIAKVDADRVTVTARYDAEKVRWKKLKAGMPAGTLVDEKGEVAVKPDLPTQIVGQSTLIAGRPRGTADCNGKTYECSLGVTYACRGANIGGPGVNAMAVPCKEGRR